MSLKPNFSLSLPPVLVLPVLFLIALVLISTVSVAPTHAAALDGKTPVKKTVIKKSQASLPGKTPGGLPAKKQSAKTQTKVLAQVLAKQPEKKAPDKKLDKKSDNKTVEKPLVSRQPTLDSVEVVDPKSDVRSFSDDYVTSVSGKPVLVSVKKSTDTGEASVFINGKEALRYRSTFNDLTPYLRAKETAHRLYRFLDEDGSPRQIKPSMVNNQVQVMADHQRLAVVDAETAQKSKNPPQGLAMIWVNQTRTLLGAETLDRNRDNANRGLIVPRPDIKLESGKKLVLQETGSIMKGLASWYGPGFNGRRSSDGSRFDMMGMTAAHRSLPFGTVVRVSNAKTGKACLVRITDRGPFTGDRIIDLSKGAASEIGMLGSGVAKVTLSVLKKSIIPSQDPSSSSNAFIGLSSLVR